jgi:hypothetical protein
MVATNLAATSRRRRLELACAATQRDVILRSSTFVIFSEEQLHVDERDSERWRGNCDF